MNREIGWSDIDITLSKKNNGDLRELRQEDAIKESLHNIFRTIPGSRRMLPTFTINLYRLLFDPVDETTAKEIGRNILDVISTWENRIIPKKIKVIPDSSKNRYDIFFVYNIVNYKQDENFEVQDVVYAQ